MTEHHTFRFPGPTDKLAGSWHQSYPWFYSKLFAPVRDTPDAILEIGTDSGSPLRAYREWFGHAGVVVGIDVNPAPELVKVSGITHLQRDAYTAETVSVLRPMGLFAVCIDDGSHFQNHQQFFVEHFCHLLAPNGILVVEDVPDWSQMPVLHGKLPHGFIGYGVDLRWQDDRYDSSLFVVHRL